MSSDNVPSRTEIESLVRQADAATFENLPSTVKPQVLSLVSKIAFSQTVTQFSGPLPPAEELLKYEQVLPGTAARLIALAENQSAHRMKLEIFIIESQQRQSGHGQWLGFVIAMAFLLGAVFTTVQGYPYVGAALGGTTLISLVTVFVLGRDSQKQNLAVKNR